MSNRPKVGVGVIVRQNGRVLLGKRKNAHGEGAWAFPGGHLEFGESWEDCARRETVEEVGINIDNVRFGSVTNDIFEKEAKHYITIFLLADIGSGVVKTMEPDKCERWEWFDWNDLPQPLFIPIQNLHNSGFDPFKSVSI